MSDVSNEGIIALSVLAAIVALCAFIGVRQRRLDDGLPARWSQSEAPSPQPLRPGVVAGASLMLIGAVVLIAGFGFGIWLLLAPHGDAVREIVAALPLLGGLIGLLIAAIGVALIVVEHSIVTASERVRGQRVAAQAAAHRIGDQPSVVLE